MSLKRSRSWDWCPWLAKWNCSILELITPRRTYSQAFESPDTLAQCVDFLRRYAVDTGAHAACLVALKSKISFPQVSGRDSDPFFGVLGPCHNPILYPHFSFILLTFRLFLKRASTHLPF